jgi:hypothetical protein
MMALYGTEQIMHGATLAEIDASFIAALHPSPYCPCEDCESKSIYYWEHERDSLMTINDLQLFTAMGAGLDIYRAFAPPPRRASPGRAIYKQGHQFSDLEQRNIRAMARVDRAFGYNGPTTSGHSLVVGGEWFECPKCGGSGQGGSCTCCGGTGTVDACPYLLSKECKA